MLGNLIEIRNQVRTEIFLSSIEVRETVDESLVVLVRIVVLINEIGDESLLVDMELSKFKRMIKSHTKFVSHSIPGVDCTGSRIRLMFGVGINRVVRPVRAMRIVSIGRTTIRW